MRAGAVAKEGTARNIGAKNRARRNIPPVVRAVSPVFPPSATPAEDSTNEVTVEVPRHAPTVVPIASARRTLPAFGSFPSLSMKPALSATPTTVPIVLNRSMYSNANTIETNWSI